VKTVDLDLAELCSRTGVTVRTVRYYVQQGLLPSPGTGPSARYTQEHLDRLQLIRRMQKEHLPLAEIRHRLDALDAAGMQRVLHTPAAPSSAADYVRGVLGHGPAPAPPPSTQRSIWERIALGRDIELHVQRPLSRLDNRKLERIIEAAMRIMNEP
jgi:DNA-binding transcriptional MerR regulator